MTPKQQRFVEEYLVDLNATQAAIRAGYSEKTAQEQSARLLSNVMVAAAVKKAMDVRSERTQIDQDRVLKELARIGLADIRHLMEWDEEAATFIPSSKLSDDIAATVSSVKTKKRTVYPKEGDPETTIEMEIRTYDKVQALTQMGRHLGMFTDKTVHEFSDLTDEERVARLGALFDTARTRRDGRAPQ